jgi:PiT family inorganic phosphate transporter
VQPGEPAFVFVVLAALIGAVSWNIITWVWALPTSSSHALVGALAGAGLAFGGPNALGLDKILATIGFIPLAPLLGFTFGAALMLTASWLLRPFRPYAVDAVFRRLQLVSAAAYSLGHGGNDAQKTVGIIVALLIAAGELPHQDAGEPVPWTIIFACNAAMAVGTSFGGWRIVKTMGMKITQLKPVGGVCAELGGALTLFGSTLWGIPVSTTHTITGSIVGVGATRRMRSIRWGMATRIIYAWLLTMPAAALLGALAFWALRVCFAPSC